MRSLDAPSGIDESALDAARGWKFQPGSINGQKVSTLVEITMRFRMLGGSPWTESGLSSRGYEEGTPGLVLPDAVRDVRPRYTREAMDLKIMGTVEMQAVVDLSGRVTDVRVTKSLDSVHGLDREAVIAIRQWRFTPCKLNGVAVACSVGVVLEFRLH